MPELGTAVIDAPGPAGVPQRLRIGIADRDSGFVLTLVKRLPALAMEAVRVSIADPDALVYLRLDALVLDISLIGDRP